MSGNQLNKLIVALLNIDTIKMLRVMAEALALNIVYI